MKINFVIPCLLGLEKLIADEMKDLGAENVVSENGRVLFSGDEHLLARANICSRYAERIQILVGTFDALSFEDLFQGTKALPWEEWIGAYDAFPVKGYSLNSALFSVSDCQSIIKKAVVERLKEKYRISWFEETGTKYQIQFSIMKDIVTVFIDTSGVGLHKRGYRPVANAAPIRETLAASMAELARLRHYHTLYDVCCGSGTILIEGAMKALNIAPGLKRAFISERFENIDSSVWQEERMRATDAVIQDADFMAYGSDIDFNALQIARENARRAGVGMKIDLSKKDLKDFARKSEKGTVICNPPYGERMLDIQAAEEIYRTMGKIFNPERGWAYYIISPDEEFEKCFGRKADKRRKLYNGMIKCQLYMYYK
jgi:putative N6-adenine-specific DNA methylase